MSEALKMRKSEWKYMLLLGTGKPHSSNDSTAICPTQMAYCAKNYVTSLNYLGLHMVVTSFN